MKQKQHFNSLTNKQFKSKHYERVLRFKWFAVT